MHTWTRRSFRLHGQILQLPLLLFLLFSRECELLAFGLEGKGPLLLLHRSVIIWCFTFEWKSHVSHFYHYFLCFLGYLALFKCSDSSSPTLSFFPLLFLLLCSLFYICTHRGKLPSDSLYPNFLFNLGYKIKIPQFFSDFHGKTKTLGWEAWTLGRKRMYATPNSGGHFKLSLVKCHWSWVGVGVSLIMTQSSSQP